MHGKLRVVRIESIIYVTLQRSLTVIVYEGILIAHLDYYASYIPTYHKTNTFIRW